MRSGYISRKNDQWPRVSDHLWAVAEKYRPWQLGLFLLENEKGGIKHDTTSPALTALIEQVKGLYQNQAASEQAWLDASLALGECTGNQEIVDPLNGQVSWSEQSAFQSLNLLILAAQIRVTRPLQPEDRHLPWHNAFANACVQAAQYQGAIAAARYPTVPVPSSLFYEERLKEMADYEAYRTARQQAAENRQQLAYSAMADYFRTVRADFYRQEREEWARADAAENARIAALPFFPRTCKQLAKWWSESAG